MVESYYCGGATLREVEVSHPLAVVEVVEVPRALAGLTKGVEVYVEGRLSLNTWNGKDGAQRIGLAVTAWEVVPLGQIGRKRQPRPQHTGAPPFDDPLTF